MRILLGQLAPVPGDVPKNVDRLTTAVRAAPSDLAIFPELFLSGYRVGDRFHTLALREGDATTERLQTLAHEAKTTLVVGAPRASTLRRGEVENIVLVVTPDGRLQSQVKRYLPTFGPFEEGIVFTPTDVSRPITVGGQPVGFSICYDTFFPEVSRQLALGGAELLVVISASPVTSRRLFERLLPARAIENGLPVVYVNRVGVEDGIVFGGASAAWDSRGEPIATERLAVSGLAPEESVLLAEVDPTESGRWRPFRPVLRDLAGRPGPSGDS
jgi:predicted amidohydrolase